MFKKFSLKNIIFYCGGNTATILTRDILRCILNELEAAKNIGGRMSILHKSLTVKILARGGHIESFKGRYVDLKHIFQSGSLRVCRRYIYGKCFNWKRCFDGEWRRETGDGRLVNVECQMQNGECRLHFFVKE